MLRRRYWCENLRKDSDSLELLNPSNSKILDHAIGNVSDLIKKVAERIPSSRSKAMKFLILRRIIKNVLADVALRIQNRDSVKGEWLMQNIKHWCINIGRSYQLGSEIWNRTGEESFRIIRKQLALPWSVS